MTMRHGVGKLR